MNLGFRDVQSFFQLVIVLIRRHTPHSPWILGVLVLFSDSSFPHPSVSNPGSLVWLFLFWVPTTSPASSLTHPFLHHVSPSQTNQLAMLNYFFPHPHPKPLHPLCFCTCSCLAQAAFHMSFALALEDFAILLPLPKGEGAFPLCTHEPSLQLTHTAGLEEGNLCSMSNRRASVGAAVGYMNADMASKTAER